MASPLVHALAGAIGSLLALLMLHPINQIKLLCQTGKGSPVVGTRLGRTAAMLREMSHEGLGAMYRGVVPVLCATAISQGVYFALYNITTGKVLWRSGISAVLSTFATSPIWVAATRLQLLMGQSTATLARKHGGVLAILAETFGIARAEGVLALWGGMSSSIWLCLVPVLQFCTYEWLRSFSASLEHPSAREAFIMGGVSKLVAGSTTYPFQVAQSRQRVDAQSGSLLKVLSSIVHESGVLGLFAGFEAKFLLTLLNGAFGMCFYEKILEIVVSVAEF